MPLIFFYSYKSNFINNPNKRETKLGQQENIKEMSEKKYRKKIRLLKTTTKQTKPVIFSHC